MPLPVQTRGGGGDNLLSLVGKLYHDAFAKNSISTMTSKEFYCVMVGLLKLKKLDKKRRKAIND